MCKKLFKSYITRSKFDPWRDAVLYDKREQVRPVKINYTKPQYYTGRTLRTTGHLDANTVHRAFPLACHAKNRTEIKSQKHQLKVLQYVT